ncbi:MAG TPA: GAF domain-containing protein, partial [Actinomycetota bacterium]|nr:GAF domain-containing protein [Actinomycetota bacterium]
MARRESERLMGHEGNGKGRSDSGHILNLLRDLRPMQEATDIRDLLAGLAQAVLGATKADACLVSLLDSQRRILRDAAAAVVPPHTLNLLVEEFSLDQFPVTEEVLRSGRGVEISVNDPEADPAERDELREVGFGRVLLNRLAVDGEPIGTIEAYRKPDVAFHPDDARHVDLLATFAANAYSKIQLASKLEEHYTKTIEALCSALEARDPNTNAHTGRIRDLAVVVADA